MQNHVVLFLFVKRFYTIATLHKLARLRNFNYRNCL